MNEIIDGRTDIWRRMGVQEITDFTYHDANDSLTVRVPRPWPADAAKIGTELGRRGAETLRTQLTASLPGRIAAAMAPWRDPQSPERRTALRWLPVITGYAPVMVERSLQQYFRTFLADQLWRFLCQDFPDPSVLDHPVPDRAGGWTMASGPRVLGQIAAGNVPGVAVWHIVAGLLIKTPVLTRLSQSEILIGVLMAQMMDRTDPDLAGCIATAYWPSDDRETESAFFHAVDCLVVYGSQPTVDAIAVRAHGVTRVVPYGHRVSIGIIGREALNVRNIPQTVERAGEDVAVWDQQSCTSPHTLIVEEGGHYPPQDFAARLGAEMARRAISEPRAPLSWNEHITLRQFKQKSEWEEGLSLWEGAQNEWAVLYGTVGHTPFSCLGRTILVIPVSTLEKAPAVMRTFHPYLQSAGVFVHRERLWTMLPSWAEVGVTRVCPLGQMSQLPAGWRHDGGSTLADLVRYMAVDSGTFSVLDALDEDTW